MTFDSELFQARFGGKDAPKQETGTVKQMLSEFGNVDGIIKKLASDANVSILGTSQVAASCDGTEFRHFWQ